MSLEVRSLVESVNLGGLWLCPFCGQEARNNKTCQCGAAIYGRGDGRFIAKKSDRGVLSSKEVDEAQDRFNKTIRTKK